MQREQLLAGPAVVCGVSLPKALHDALVEKARLEDRPVSRIVKAALVHYFSEGNGDQKQQIAEVGGES